jgi:hypothetical protein
MSGRGFKFGQIVGILVGVIAGSMLVNMILAPKRPQPVLIIGAPQSYNPNVAPQQQGVFEQALSMPKAKQL